MPSHSAVASPDRVNNEKAMVREERAVRTHASLKATKLLFHGNGIGSLSALREEILTMFFHLQDVQSCFPVSAPVAGIFFFIS